MDEQLPLIGHQGKLEELTADEARALAEQEDRALTEVADDLDRRFLNCSQRFQLRPPPLSSVIAPREQ